MLCLVAVFGVLCFGVATQLFWVCQQNSGVSGKYLDIKLNVGLD